ncbi:type I restriction endonuclease [Schlesneria paludicola]|uniref:type I restriction endonuclease n=1 Tax=Schlesneria paludicola TaxID=360056 RepID=UPI00029A1A22|nr:type I restriction endonuclease [Schlesneria paludicola]
MTNTDFSENALVEQPAISLFEELGWPCANCFYEKIGGANSTHGRETTSDVIRWPRLKSALQKLNPVISSDAIQLAIDAGADVNVASQDVHNIKMDESISDAMQVARSLVLVGNHLVPVPS